MVAEPELDFGEAVEWSDWRNIIKLAATRLCYWISTKYKVKRCIKNIHDSYTLEMLLASII